MKKIKAIFAKVQQKLGKKMITAITAVTAVSTMAVCAGAEGTTPTGISGMTSIVQELLNICTLVFNYMLSNWYLLIFFGGAIIFAAIKIFKGIKKAAKAG